MMLKCDTEARTEGIQGESRMHRKVHVRFGGGLTEGRTINSHPIKRGPTQLIKTKHFAKKELNLSIECDLC